MKINIRQLFALTLLLLLSLLHHGRADSPAAKGPLRVHSGNPRYFTAGSTAKDDSLQAVYLAGFQYWDVFDSKGDPHPDGIPFDEFLNISEASGVNFIRLWRWNELTIFKYGTEEAVNYNLHPWPRPGPGNAFDGKPRFDLTGFEQAFFDTLRSRVEKASKRGMYVAVMLFEGWSLRNAGMGESHPFYKKNNINGIDGDLNNDKSVRETHTLENPAVTALQEAYVRKVIDTLNHCDNVLYEIANEDGDYSVQWQHHMIRFVKQYEASKPKQHLVGMTCLGMDDLSPAQKIVDEALFEGPADWVSPYTTAPAPYNYLDNPPPSDGRKVIISDTDHLLGNAGDRSWAWKSFTRGLHINNYMELRDLRSTSEKFVNARRATGDTSRFATRMNLALTEPKPDLSTTSYCLANPGSEYLIYQPATNRKFAVKLLPGTYQVEWFNPGDGSLHKAPSVDAGGPALEFTPPFNNDAVLYLKAQDKR